MIRLFCYTFCACTTILLLVSCGNDQELGNLTITLTNPGSIARPDEPILIDREQIMEFIEAIPENQVPLLRDAEGKPVAYQLEDIDGNGKWDQLAFTATVPASEEITYQITWIDPKDVPAFENRTNVRFGVREAGEMQIKPVTSYTLGKADIPFPDGNRFQMDGPAWENDKVGFRHYFDGRNSRDYFGKRQPAMVLELVGLSTDGEIVDNYHVLEPWGRDILATGNSVGLGGIGILKQDSAYRLGKLATDSVHTIGASEYELLVEGPVRSAFELNFNDWEVGNELLSLKETTSIWAGQYWTKNEVNLVGNQDTDTLVVGLVNSNNDLPLILVDSIPGMVILATHDKQTYNKEFFLGMAVILPAENYLGYREAPESDASITTSYNALMKVDGEESFSFYTLGAWGMDQQNFRDRAYFTKFVETEAFKIANPVQVNISQ